MSKFHIHRECDINFGLSIIGIGIDIENIERFKTHVEQGHQSFFERLFSNAEIEYCMTKKCPEQHFAARFCAKEAFVKASFGQEKFKITDVQVLKKEGKPYIEMWQKKSKGKALHQFFQSHTVLLSLSHTQAYACAQVIIQKNKHEQG
ncbi:holo-ACP synthase [bacterium]|nr:holo-ACP synthase [bacterium]